MKSIPLICVTAVLAAYELVACSSTPDSPGEPSNASGSTSGGTSSGGGSSGSSSGAAAGSSGSGGGAGNSSGGSGSSSGATGSSGSPTEGGPPGEDAGDDGSGSAEAGDDAPSGSSSGGSSSGSSSGGGSSGSNPYGDANLVSIFDGQTLNGWTSYGGGKNNSAPDPGDWVVMNGVIHGNANYRGFLATNATYDNFRFIFTERILTTVHQACVLIWGETPMGTTPLGDADGAIQFQVPNGGHWDYRPGTNTGGMGFTNPVKGTNTATSWNQCELLANITTGKARLACCTLSGTTPCKATEVLDFTNTYMTGPDVPNKAPIALQCHTGGGMTKGSVSEYKDLYVETNPTQDALITTQ